MKQSLRLLIVFAIFCTPFLASAQPFVRGTNVASLGIGLGGNFGSFSYGSQTPGISVQYERGIWEVGGPGVISLGGYAGVKGYKYSASNGMTTYSQKWNYTVIGVRSAYHYNGLNHDQIDVYGGLMLSYNILSYKYEGPSNTPGFGSNFGSAAGFTAFVGGRYFFVPNLAAFLELGYGVSYLTLGAALKF